MTARLPRPFLWGGILALVLAAAFAIWWLPRLSGRDLQNASLPQLERRVATEPDNPQVRLWHARRVAESGDLGRAEQLFTNLVGQDPNFTPALRELGKVLLAEGRVEPAFQFLRSAVGRDPQDVEALVALGQLYQRQGSDHRAMEMLDRALSLEPDHVPALYLKAAAHASVEQWGAAEECLRRALRKEPKNEPVLVALSRIRRERGDLTEAESLARLALQEQKDDPNALLALARAVAVRPPVAEHRQEAIGFLEQARKLAPDRPDLALELGRLQSQAGRPDAAIASLLEALRLRPDLTTAHYLLARAYLATGQGVEAAKSESVFRKLQAYDREVADLGSQLGAHPDSAALRFRIAEVHARYGRPDRAVLAYRSGLQRDPQNARARNRLAELEQAAAKQAPHATAP